MNNDNKGFTLIEMLVSLAIFIVIISFSSVGLHGRQLDAELELATTEYIGMLKLARSNSISGFHDSQWGVYLNDKNQHSFVLYKGSNYLNRDNNFDRVFDFGENISYISSQQDINFTIINGFISNDVSIEISSLGLEKNIHVNINKLAKIERNG